MGLDGQTMSSQVPVQGLPVRSLLAHAGQDACAETLGIAFKGFLASVSFHRGGSIAEGGTSQAGPTIEWDTVFSRLALLAAFITGQVEAFLQLAADAVPGVIIPEGFMPGQFIRVNHVVSHVHVQVGRVCVDPAMPLMLLEPQGLGKFGLYFLQCSPSQLSFVFRPETYDEMIGLFLQSPGVESLSIGHLLDGKLVIVAGPAPGAPSQEAFFTTALGVGDVVGQTTVIIVLRFSRDSSADHHDGPVIMSNPGHSGLEFPLPGFYLTKHTPDFLMYRLMNPLLVGQAQLEKPSEPA